jgi:hypothetical protein
VDFDTAKPVFETAPDKCHVSHVVADTGSWEQKLAQTLESMPEVLRFVRNEGLNFTIPYTLNGEERQYFPDFHRRDARACAPERHHRSQRREPEGQGGEARHGAHAVGWRRSTTTAGSAVGVRRSRGP